MPSFSNTKQDPPRDRVTGVPAESRRPRRVTSSLSSSEVEQEIRRTRARLGATLDELEDRISPAHIRDEVQHSVRRTIDDVRAEYSPTKMAKRAQNTMFETIKDNPIPALAAGLSVGYLIMKGAERSDDVRGDYPRRGRYDVGYDGRGPGYYEAREAYTAERPNRVRASGEYVASEEFAGDETSGRSAGDRMQEGAHEARERIGEARERTGEMAREAVERAGDMREEAAGRARHAAHSAERRTKQAARQARQKAVAAEHSLEDFVYDNPLAAGALAIGVGALLGGLFPSTKMEDEWLGPARDEAVGRAKRAAEASMASGRESAKKVMHDAKESARDVAETAKSEAKKTAEAAKDRAASDSGDTTSDSHGRSDTFRPKMSDPY